ncbi:hypothetical protein EN41_26515 [Agrobacterium tumefaciens]|nr:hypothetical protein EN41_26515 [Agrobacterium tumefaciens]
MMMESNIAKAYGGERRGENAEAALLGWHLLYHPPRLIHHASRLIPVLVTGIQPAQVLGLRGVFPPRIDWIPVTSIGMGWAKSEKSSPSGLNSHNHTY